MSTGVLAEGDIKTVYGKELARFAIKIASRFFHSQRPGLPTDAGLWI